MWITANWKILKVIGIPDHLTCLLRNLYVGQETNNLTTLYFKIIRYPDSPLLATWNSTTAQYEFAIEWN